MINKNYVRYFFTIIFIVILSYSGASNAYASILLSDTFVGTIIDTANWQEIDAAGSGGSAGKIQQNNSLTIDGDGSWGDTRLVSQNAFNRSEILTLEADFSINASGVFAAPIAFGKNTALNSGTADNYWITIHNSGNFFIARGNSGVWTTLTSTGVPVVVNRRYKGKINIGTTSGATFELYQDTNGDGDFNDAGEDTDLFDGGPNSIADGNLASGYFMTSTYSSSATTTIYNTQVNSNISTPDAPTSLIASPASSQIDLFWTAPVGNGGSAITDYKIEYKLASSGTWLTFTDGISTNTTATVTGLTNGQSYDFRVSATNSVGTGSVSSTVTATPNISSPGAPQNLDVLTGANTTVDLFWTAPVGNGGSAITDYKIEYKLASSGTWLTFTDGISTNTTATVTGLTNGQSYDFRVSATNSVGTGSVSSTVTATPTIYALSDIFTGTSIDTSKWTEVDAGGLGGTMGNVQQNNGLIITGTNAWGANGLESIGTFDRSNGDVEITVTMQATSCTSGNNFEFGYGDMAINPNGTSYIITKNSSNWILYNWQNGSSAGSVSIPGVSCTNNTDLTMKLVVLQGGGAEVYLGESATPAATTSWGTINNQSVWMQGNSSGVTTTFQNIYVFEPLVGPLAPSNLSGMAGDAEVDLTWTAPVGNGGSAITDYKIEYKLASSGTWLTFTDGISTNTTATVTGLTNGQSYDFRVSAINVNGTSDASATASYTPISSTPTTPSASSVAITGSVSIGETITGTYTFNDVNGDSEATSLYRWLISDTVNGTYSAISGATSINYTIVSSDLNKYLKFEVIPVSNASPYTGNTILSDASSQVNQINYFNHILSTGQSLSTGQGGSPALSTTQPYTNKMLSGVSLVPLVESGVETMSSAMANTLTSLSIGGDFQSAVTRNGVGGTAYSGLKKGTSSYNNGITQVTNVKNAATALGMIGRVIGVTTIHGESDHIAGNGSVYESYLAEWQSDYETDIKAVTGQSGTIPLFTDQMSSHTSYNSTTSLIPIAQLSAAENNPGKIVLVAPKYFFTYSSGAHLTNESYRWLGEYYGKVMGKVVLGKETWKPLSPSTVTRNTNIIYADFYVPEGELSFDTTLVSARTNFGFEYFDNTSSASISSVEIFDEDTVKITLSGTPTGSDQRLRYAYTGVSGSASGAQNNGSAAGNLRDTDTTPSLYGNTLYNWAVHFDKAITEDSSSPVLSNISVTPAETTATINWNTSELGSSIVDYGLTSTYEITTIETNTSPRVASHTASLSSLVACTTYHYRVRSKDLAQNQGTSSDSTFTTRGCTGDATVLAQVSSSVISASGGSLDLLSGGYGIGMVVPAGSTAGNAEYQLKKVDSTEALASSGKPSGFTLIGDYTYELNSLSNVNTPITSFLKPIQITISYKESDFPGIDESSLRIYHYSSGLWSALAGCTVNTTLNTVTCTTTSFSLFSLFGTSTTNKSNSGSRIIYGCSDLKANNYKKFVAHKQSLCTYDVNQKQNTIKPSNYLFTTSLSKGSYNQDVVALQKILNQDSDTLVAKTGPGSPGNETRYFGSLTVNAVQRYQIKYGIAQLGNSGFGYVGPMTRKSLNEILS